MGFKKRRERKRKRRVLQGGSLIIEEGEELIRNTQTQQEECSDPGKRQRLEGKRRRCGLCNRVGHNARTCKQAEDPIEVE